MRQWYKKLTKNHGMTLIEVITAFAVMGVIVGVVISAQLTSITTEVTAKKRNEAVFLAQSALEQARNWPVTSTLTGSDIVPIENGPVTNFPTVTRKTYLSVDPGGSDMLRINVAVGWPNGDGTFRYVYATSLRANK